MTRFVAWTLSLIMGCTSIGPGKLVPTDEGYNDAVQLAMTREVLKNISLHPSLEAFDAATGR